MARRGARGKGWIRLMRVIIWILAALILVIGIGGGIAMISASGQAQDVLAQVQGLQTGVDASSLAALASFKGMGVGIIAGSVLIALILLVEVNVFLDMAENVRRIAAKVTRRSMEEE